MSISNPPITSALALMTNQGYFNYLRFASEADLRKAIETCTNNIRRQTAIGWFISRFNKKPFPYQPGLFD